MAMSVTADVGKGIGGLGKLIFYGVLAYVVYSIYKGSSFSYFGAGSVGLNNNWKPLSEREINELRYIISER